MTQAIVTSAYRKARGGAIEKSGSVLLHNIPALEKMLWGGTVVLLVDHLIHGELFTFSLKELLTELSEADDHDLHPAAAGAGRLVHIGLLPEDPGGHLLEITHLQPVARQLMRRDRSAPKTDRTVLQALAVRSVELQVLLFVHHQHISACPDEAVPERRDQPRADLRLHELRVRTVAVDREAVAPAGYLSSLFLTRPVAYFCVFVWIVSNRLRS